MLIAGLDEAGRGPPIGPLVMAGIRIDEKKKGWLKRIGVKDSKLLTRQKREELFDKIINLVDSYKIFIIPPIKIDEALNSESNNLNWLEADCMLDVIHALQPEKAYLDSPSRNIPAFTSYLKKRLACRTDLIVEHKADLNHAVCGAASILAKVTRDREIEKIHELTGIDFGAGYGLDMRTYEFIRDYHDKYPEFFRKSWASYRMVVDGKSQKKLFNFGIEKQDHPKLKKIACLEERGYCNVELTSPFQLARLKGPATVTLFTSGKVLIQGGSEDEKEFLKCLLV